jgi:hypothetical protein
MALARRDHLPFLLIAQPIVWPLWPARVILERFSHRHQSAGAEFVEIAAGDPELGGHLGGLLSPEQRQHGLQSTFPW